MLIYVLIFAMFLVGVVPIVLDARRRGFELFDVRLGFVAYYLLQLGVSALFALQTDSVMSEFDPSEHPEAFRAALAWAVVGLAMFQLGYAMARSRVWIPPRLLVAKWSVSRVDKVTYAYLAIGLLAFVALMHSAGGLASFLEDRESWRGGGLKGQGILIFPATSLMSIATLSYLAVHAGDETRRSRNRVKIAMLVVVSLIPAMVMGFRASILLPLVQVAFVVHMRYRKLSARFLVIASLLAAMFFTVYGLTRALPQEAEITMAELAELIEEQPDLVYNIVVRSRGAEVVSVVIDTLNTRPGYDLGWRAAVEALTIWIPRAVWPDKPLSTGERFSTMFFIDILGREEDVIGGVSATAVGELYWHFGGAGVLLGMLSLGAAARIVQNTGMRHLADPAMLVSFAILFSTMCMFAETLQGYVNGLVLQTFVLGITFWLVSERRRRPS